MRAAGTTRPIDGGSGGGGGGGGTVALIDSPDSSLSLVNPAGPTASITLAGVGVHVVVGTLAQLDAVAPAVGGLRTLSVPIYLVGTIVLPFGDHFTAASAGVIAGLNVSTCGFVANYAGPVFAGPISVSNATLVNVNPAGWMFAITALLAETIVIETVIISASKIGTATNTVGLFQIDNLLHSDGSAGSSFVLDGTILVFGWARLSFVSPTAPGLVGVEILSTATLVLGGNLRSTWASLPTPNFGTLLRFSDSASYPTGALPSVVLGIDISDPNVSAGSEMLDESAGNLTTRSIELFVKNATGGRSSARVGGAQFTDLTSPITAPHAVGNLFEIFPHTDGVATNLAAISAEERFTLVRASTGLPLSPADPVTDWAIQYNGVSPLSDAKMEFDATIEGVGGAVDMQATILHRSGLVDPFVDTGATATTEQSNRKELIEGSEIKTLVMPGDQWTWATRVVTGTASTVVYHLKIQVEVK